MRLEVSKHALHCILMYSWFGFIIYHTGFTFHASTEVITCDRFGCFFIFCLYISKCVPLLAVIPSVSMKNAPALTPLICFRIVTRGSYPKLVEDNLIRNMEVCNKSGLQHLIFEEVTDKEIGITMTDNVRELVVPCTYKTKTGALFKARALQYCLEEGVNRLQVCGIANFVSDGVHDFGQGLITYASGRIVNWLTTLADSTRRVKESFLHYLMHTASHGRIDTMIVADDCGKVRAQLSLLHKPIFGWKGSYVVAKHGAERLVSWDHGSEGSICEDAYFALMAIQAGYSFDFIEGEMHEQSPFTVMDMLRQRKRWLEGLILTVHLKEIRLIHKIPLALTVYCWVLTPIATLLCLLIPTFTALPRSVVLDTNIFIILALNAYMGFIGSLTTLPQTRKYPYFPMCFLSAFFAVTFNVYISVGSVAMFAVSSNQKSFYIVKKDSKNERRAEHV